MHSKNSIQRGKGRKLAFYLSGGALANKHEAAALNPQIKPDKTK